jgi:hypothetical protein
VVAQVCRRLHHPPRGARGADSTAFAGESDEVVMPTVAAASAGKAMGKEQTLQSASAELRPDVAAGPRLPAQQTRAKHQSDNCWNKNP